MASLIVSFPLFAFFFLRITKRTIEDVSIRMLKSRKFLIYLTLVVTFIILIINVITLVYTFIGGNITVNFFLKFLITLIVSGMIFAYYLYEVREDWQKLDKS
jgi:predicted neutral ceramidase superfamily lipid hydrolase